MTTRRRLASGFVAAAAVLLFGRVSALLYADHAWYDALGAVALWRERIGDIVTIQLCFAVFAGLFALLNLSAIRRSIVSLAFPRRLGNVEFGEAVPRKILDRAAFVLAAGVAALMSLAVPSWDKLALVRAGVRFGETDPFFQMDIGFYTAWLPLESAAYVWCLALLILVSVIVTGLYALTPSLRWHRGAFQVSVRVRRHLSVLASLFLLMMAWSYRLDGYELLIKGSGPDGMFSYVDHQWLIPAYLSLSVGTVAAGALVIVSGWTGQLRAGFFTISAVLIFSVALDLILPSVVRRFAGTTAIAARERPYVATRAAFTARAYGLPRNAPQPPPHEVTRFAAFADSARIAKVMSSAKDSALVYPGAVGAALVLHGRQVAAPLLGTGLRRLALAWSEQRLDLAWSTLPENARLARNRDVRRRVRSLMPVFTQGSGVVPGYIGDTLVWIAELYSASASYPLSRHYPLAGEERSYFRHSGTALVNSATGRVTVVPSSSPDPTAVAWRARFPANIRPGGPDLLDELTSGPRQTESASPGSASPASDAAFRTEVRRLFARMRSALSAGDLMAFAAAYDSLGIIVGR
ncbi:MAG: UPF0182 family protein [Gemmatimonadaceae bacterium]|nr:UPF0182 family protein [Gemmatimonadaceae bacterium]